MAEKVIIAEKPDAARRIAAALSSNKYTVKESKYGVKYYKFRRENEGHLVVAAAGHLFNLQQVGAGWNYPAYESEWVPSYKARKESAFTEKYFKTIEAVATDGKDYVVACDLDEEGSLIGANIVKFICKQENAYRMKFSTLTKADLIHAYEQMHPSLDVNLIEAGETRHRLDWLYGVNITRALTKALNKNADLGFKVISAGRVQSPTLALLLEREKKIRAFQPTPYWEIKLVVTVKGKQISAFHEKEKFWKKEKANKIIRKCQLATPNIVNITRKTYKQPPPTPFNLTDLQSAAYRHFKYPPKKTLNIAEDLYMKGYISYPRTASQKLPPKIKYRRILKAIKKLGSYRSLASKLLEKGKLQPREGKKKDPAHIAIYPTHEPPKTEKKLNKQQKKMYDLIVRRFMATFADPALRESIKLIISQKGERFETRGRRTLKENWHIFYEPYVTFRETDLPHLEGDTQLNLNTVELLAKETTPPRRYSSASLVRKMEELELGTKATRSQIVDILFDRRYLRGQSIEVTHLGEAVINILKKYCPKLANIKLTREFIHKIEEVRTGELDQQTVVKDAKKVLKEIVKDFKKKEEEIGKTLTDSFKKAQKADSRIGKCPKCGNELRIIYSKKTHKRFVGCTGYFKGECNFSAPLPQEGKIKPTEKKCKYCGYPMVMVLQKGNSKPWFLCINPDCEAKKQEDTIKE